MIRIGPSRKFAVSLCRLTLPRTRSASTITDWKPDSALVDSRNAPADFDTQCAVVYRDFISNDEGAMLAQELERRMRRRRYEKGHWDAVINDFKEVELTDDSMEDPRILQIFERTRQFLEREHLVYKKVSWLPCHGIDLKKNGELNAHVDSVKFSGDLVAGISLKSHAIMRLAPHIDGASGPMDGYVDLWLPPLSLYALTGVARYRYSHELMKDENIFIGTGCEQPIYLSRDHRLSIIFRDAVTGAT